MVEENETIIGINVESRDIHKNPFLFSLTYFHPDKIELLYTYTAGMSPKKRKLDMLKYLLNLLTLLGSNYSIDNRKIYQMLENALSEMEEYVTSDYDKLYSLYDSLKSEVISLQKRVRDLQEANTLLSRENYELKVSKDELANKLAEFQSISDEVLASKIQNWIHEHNSEINITEFSKTYGVPESRVEAVLNRLVLEGYLAIKE
ncbi:MAG: hypothetical protein QXW70_01655 [Candidatus Anstonellales archaeon]